jgi:hypothetical protein
MQNILINTHSLCQVLGRWESLNYQKLMLPENQRKCIETKMVRSVTINRYVHQWAEREYRLNSLAASFEQKLTHNPKLIVPWFSNSYGKNRNCPNSKNIAAYSN